MKWKRKTVIVTGGTGFIGSHLCDRLLSLGAYVHAIDNGLTGKIKNIEHLSENPDFIWKAADLRDRWSKAYVDHHRPEVIFQLAANMGGMGYLTSKHAEVMRDNAIINLNMLESAVNADVDRFFYSSSACVYPEEKQLSPEVIPLKESDAIPANPDLGYGWEKIFTEKLCEYYHRDFNVPVRVARFHNVFGPRASYRGGREKVIGALLRKAIRYPDEDFIVWGDGKQTRSFLYIDDCLDGILTLTESLVSGPYNIGSDRLVTISELADIIIKVSGKDIVKEFDTTKPQGVRGRNADLTLVKKDLGWYPKVTLEKGISEFYKWILADIKERQ
jgi:nucleoside-diphosphate-sugar epimerase